MSRVTLEERGPIALAEKILTLLDEGSFTATYKYAVLLGLIDLCLENTSRTGVPPEMLTTRQLAEKIVELYWPQSTPYVAEGRSPSVLTQNAGRPDSQAAIIRRIEKFRADHARDPSVPLARARYTAPAAFERLVRFVEWKLIQMPLPRLQVIGTGADRFLYTIHWDQDVARSAVTEYQKEGGGAFDNRILLRPRVGEHLVQLNGLLRPLIHRQWARMVAQLNRLEEARLEEFLFGAARVPTDPVRPGLRDVQSDRCFYCDGKLGDRAGRRVQVDHFIPWARYPNNAIENLVVSHERCNGYKRDFLAAAEHVAHWRERLQDEPTAEQLLEIAEDVAWERAADRSVSVARAIYLRLPEDGRLWLRGREFETVDRVTIEAVLS